MQPKFTRDPLNAGRKRAQRLLPVPGACEACGAPATERHHRDGSATNNAPENLAPLCRPCHEAAHLLTHCRRGHPLSGPNLYLDPRGRRRCRACQRLTANRRYQHAPRRTHCKRGHPLTVGNVYLSPDGKRRCRECRRLHP